MKKIVLAGLAATMSLALAACSESEPEVLVDEDPNALLGVNISNARFVMPAVSGNPAAIYFDLAYTGDRDTVIRRVDVAGAQSATLHETVEQDGSASMVETFQHRIAAGETVKFEPGGLHVMAMGLASDITEGAQVEVTLTFVGGDKASFLAPVQGAGEDR